jgi:hypothetical protein
MDTCSPATRYYFALLPDCLTLQEMASCRKRKVASGPLVTYYHNRKPDRIFLL